MDEPSIPSAADDLRALLAAAENGDRDWTFAKAWLFNRRKSVRLG